MDVISASPFFPCGSVVFRPRVDRFSLVVVCKATFALTPGESGLSLEQEEINARDVFWDDDPRRSVYAPSDLSPPKRRADVVLVGHAFAPRSEKARTLSARLIVGDIEKAIDVYSTRVLTREGELREGPRWSKMALRYEYAAGGIDTSNPVGIGPTSASDPYGQRPLPHLQPAGLRVVNWGDAFVPVGFGPIAPTWRPRRDKLGRFVDAWSDETWTSIPLDDDFNIEFFQSAPPDQQLLELRGGEPITLEYLHPDHPHMTTTLAAVRPRAFIEAMGSSPRDVAMTADTLWIDTDRAICTVTWRGQVPVDGPTHPGRVVIVMEEAGQQLTWANIAKLAGSAPPAKRDDDPPTAPGAQRFVDPPPFRVTDPSPGSYPVAPRPGTRPPSDTQAPAEIMPFPDKRLLTETVRPSSPAQEPTWLAATRATAAVMLASPLTTTADTTTPPVPGSAAKDRIDYLNDPPTKVVAAVEPPPLAKVRPANETALEVVWFDPMIAPRLREDSAWIALLDKLRSDEAADASVVSIAVLSRAEVSRAVLEDALFGSVADHGHLAPTLLVLAGEIQMLFDEVEALRAMIGAAAPMARADPRLREVLDFAEEMLKGGLPGSPDVTAWLRTSLRDTWMEANRGLSPNYLDSHAERSLLERRLYHCRELLDQTWIRAAWIAPGGGPEVPAYLPVALSRRLPLFTRFPARIIAELLPRQDQYETHPVALRVVALGRVVSRLT